MTGYLFKLENDKLVCVRIMDGDSKEFSGNEALNRLKSLDAIKYKKARVTNYGIMLESNKTRLYINSDVLFTKENYQNCLYHNMGRINKALVKYNKNLNKGKNITTGVLKGTATVGILAAIGIAVASGNLKDNTFVNDEVIEQMDDNFEFEIEEIDNVSVQEKQPVMQNKELIGIDSKNLEVSPDDLIYELDNDTPLMNLSFNDSFDEVKYKHVYDNFYDMVAERAPRWGVSTNLVMSMISQESGGYSDNLMQIQWWSWADQPITLFNFEKGEYETIVLTEEPERYENSKVTQTISKEDLKNPKTNISVGCIILRYCFDRMNYNMAAAIQAYNYGTNNMKKVLETAALDLGCTVDDLLSNKNDTQFLNYRNIVDVGDPNYVENTLRFLQDPNEEISIRYVDSNGEIKETSVVVNNSKSTRIL